MAGMMAILLAGGRSVRVGVDKATFEMHGEMLVERHLRQLRTAGVHDALAVCNATNEAVIRARTGVRTVLQRGNSMSAAILTGIEEAHAADICAVCVNDIVADDDYQRILAFPSGEEEILIPTRPLERVFAGGCLDIDSATGAVRGIVEKPAGGCPAGAAANVMIHRIHGEDLLHRLAALLRSGTEYEDALNKLIGAGVRVGAIPIRSWIAIKTPEDIARAEADAASQPRNK